jgi:hypothetical protein
MSIKNGCLTFTIFLLLVFDIYAQFEPGICDEDDRTLTGNPRVGRIWKQDTGECKGTAFLISNGKLITAGHVAAQMVISYPNSIYYIEFNDFNPEDRYKVDKSSIILDVTYENNGVDSGHD